MAGPAGSAALDPVPAFKVVVAGAFAVGKTALIQEISDTAVVGTEAETSGAEAAVKATTTVGLEYGTLRVGDGPDAVELRLHGLPGQERFRVMWDLVAEGADGVLVLVDATRPTTWAETAAMAEHLRTRTGAPLVLGVNRAGGDDTVASEVAAALGMAEDLHVPCEVVDRASARSALVTLLLAVLDRLDAELVEDEPLDDGFGGDLAHLDPGGPHFSTHDLEAI